MAGMKDERSLSERVYQQLLDDLIFDRIPKKVPISVVSLAERLGVSRTPVHEAILHLERDGLLHRKTNQRPVPKEFSREDIHEIFEMRKLLEVEAVGRAASRIELPSLLQIQDELEALRSEKDEKRWVDMWTNHDANFHSLIAEHCGLPRLSHDIQRYRTLHRILNSSIPGLSDLYSALDDHQAIFNALEKHDVEGARKSMLKHLSTWQRYFTKHFKVGGSVSDGGA